MTLTVEEGQDIAAIVRDTGRIRTVHDGYSNYRLVRDMRAMVARGDLGRVRVMVANFAHGHHADTTDSNNPRVLAVCLA